MGFYHAHLGIRLFTALCPYVPSCFGQLLKQPDDLLVVILRVVCWFGTPGVPLRIVARVVNSDLILFPDATQVLVAHGHLRVSYEVGGHRRRFLGAVHFFIHRLAPEPRKATEAP